MKITLPNPTHDAMLQEAIAKMQDGWQPKPFWTAGEIPDSIEKQKRAAVTYKRIRNVRNYLHSNGHGCEDDELEILCDHAQQSKRRLPVAALALKYLALKIEEQAGGAWTFQADQIAEQIALGAVKEHNKRVAKGEREA